jgi:predicted aldo/keto reductase-like oxidoreductase
MASYSPSRRTFLFTGLAASQAARATAQTQTKASAPLRFRVLGKTGLRVTEVGHGSEAIGDPSVLARSAGLGVNFFDTAHAYQGGNNERVLGEALAGRRKSVIIATRSYRDTAAEVQRELDESLRLLRTDYIDIWYLGHRNKPESITDDMLAVQYAAQKAGKIRFRGLSTHRPAALQASILNHGKFDVVQIPYNFTLGTPKQKERGLDAASIEQFLDKMKEAGIGVVAMKVLAGAYKQTDGPAARATALASIRWVFKTGRVHTSSIRMSGHDQLADDVAAMEAPFSPSDEKLIATQLARISPVFCRMCGSCDGACPNGLPVADMVRFVTYAEGYGRPEMAAASFRDLPAAQRAVRCSDCAACPVRCPNGVRVRRQVSRAQALFA